MSLLQFTRRFTSTEPNLYHFVMDIAWFGLALATTTRFLSVYAIHLGATASHLALMTSLPALMLLISSMFSGWWRSRHQDTHHAVLLPSFSFRLSFIFLAFTPFLPAEWQPTWIVVLLTLAAIPQGISGVIFLGLMRESVSAENWTTLNSQRHIAMNLSIAVGALCAGIWLQKMPFPLNYQIMFLFAFGATLFSLWHVARIKPQFAVTYEKPSLLSRHLWKSKHFKHMLLTVVLTHIPFFMIYPLVPLQLIDGFGASESFIAIFSLAELTGGICIAGFANQWMKRWSQYRVMSTAMICTGFAVAIIALAPTLMLTLPAAFILGGSWTLVGIGLMGLISDHVPAEQGMSYNMIFTQCVGLSVFIGPLLGNILMSNGINLVTALIVGAGLRIIGGWLIGLQHEEVASENISMMSEADKIVQHG